MLIKKIIIIIKIKIKMGKGRYCGSGRTHFLINNSEVELISSF